MGHAHRAPAATPPAFAAPRWYQVNVTGGTVAANLPPGGHLGSDGANVIYRFMPSVAVDRAGDMAIGYSTSSSTTKPAIKYAGRLAGDPVNTFSQTEQLLIQGTGTQVGNCGGSSCTRWGDYSAMTLDPDGCTFWYTNEYYQVDGLNDHTRIGSFAFPACTPVAGGTLPGTVTDVGAAPIAGATVDARQPHDHHRRQRRLFVLEPSGRHLSVGDRERSRLRLADRRQPRRQRRRDHDAGLFARGRQLPVPA